jgi:NitT/TauT family transport system ATP-binding protein
MSTGGAISLRGLGIHFGEGKSAVQALTGIDLDIGAGEFVSVLGPSGCGKSTIIGAVAGFTPTTAGQLEVDGQRVRAPGPDRGVVFQQHTLFPWKTVAGNVEFGLKMRGIGTAERKRTARDILAHVGLGEFVDHYPHQLSGGMQQRVNLARVLVNRPRVLLMDEPFCSLDAQTRLQMQELLLGLWHEFHMTVVFVTHDVDEAVFLSDRVVVLTRRPGRIKAEIPVALPRPRDHELLTSADFTRLKRQALNLLLGETPRPPAREPAAHPLPVLIREEQGGHGC